MTENKRQLYPILRRIEVQRVTKAGRIRRARQLARLCSSQREQDVSHKDVSHNFMGKRLA